MQLKCDASVPLLSFVALSFSLLLVGCSSPPTTAVQKPFQDGVLTLAGPEDTEAVLRSAVRVWQSRQGASPATFVGFDAEKGPAQTADLWVLPTWRLPHWIAAGKLRPLPETLTWGASKSTWPGLLPIYRDSLVVWKGPTGRLGTPFAVPLLGEAPLLCYRLDLYADPKHQQGYRQESGQELAPPQTWAEFARQAAYFHKAGFPLPPLADDPVTLERWFGQVASGYARPPVYDQGPNQGPLAENALGLFQDPATGKPRLTEPGLVHGLRLLQTLQASRERQRPESGSPEMAFRSGRAALCVCEAPWIVRFQEANSPVRDRVGVVGLPGAEKSFDAKGETEFRVPNRMPYLGSGSLVVVLPVDAPHPEAASSLLAHLLDRQVSESLILNPRDACRVVRGDQLMPECSWGVLGLDSEQTAATKAALRWTLEHTRLKNPALALRLPATAEYRNALARHLRRALFDNVDAKTALAEAAREWEQLGAKFGHEKIRADVRVSLGLAP